MSVQYTWGVQYTVGCSVQGDIISTVVVYHEYTGGYHEYTGGGGGC